MSPERLFDLFTVFGKLLKLDELGAAYASGVKAQVVATQEQLAANDGADDPYGEVMTFLVPLTRTVAPVAQGLDRVPMLVKSACDSYLRVTAGELGQPSTAAPAAIVDSLRGTMQALGESVAPSGRFFLYFRDTYGVQLPQNASPTISDALISTVIW